MQRVTMRWGMILGLLLLLAARPGVGAETLTDADLFLNFRYTPQWWVTAICPPDDGGKTVVGRNGELLYHYVGRFHDYKVNVGFQTTVGVVVSEDAQWVRQELETARIPIVKTWRESPSLTICEEAFAVVDPLSPAGAVAAEVRRTDTGDILAQWATPPAGFSPALADAAMSTRQFPPRNQVIRYVIQTPVDGTRKVALAVCEGWHAGPGRVLEMSVEGSAVLKTDVGARVGKNKPEAFWFDARDVDGDGQIKVEVRAAPESKDKRAVLNGLWVFTPETETDSVALLAGRMDDRALAALYGGRSRTQPRNDVILVHVTNTSSRPQRITPALVVRSERPLQTDLERQQITIHDQETIQCSLRMQSVRQYNPQKRIVQLEAVDIQPGATARWHVLYAAGTPVVSRPRTTDEAQAMRRRAFDFWDRLALPYGRVEIPDPPVQALFDACVRNIWQAREMKGGLPAFQVGPAVYRGLWIVDGAFMLEAAAMLGAVDEARAGITYMLKHQRPNGSFEVLDKYYKENGIVLWACIRHARLTTDREWLASIWPQLEKTVDYIRELRRMSYENPEWLCQGLIPPGFVDGGVHFLEKGDYSNVYWNLAGLKAAIDAAHWLGKRDQAARWQAEYDDFYAVFQKAARRDMRKDAHGIDYLPDGMGNVGNLPPQKGQWAFFHAVYPGKIFAADDPVLIGNMAMFQMCEEQGGLIVGNAGLSEGIWGYLGSFYAHAFLWQGKGREAARRLYAFGNHASPLLTWREEQNLAGEPETPAGDMPHNWASAEFIRLAIHLLALERGDELHLFEGMPREWLGPGMVTRLHEVRTPFGPLTLELRVASDGQNAALTVAPLSVRGGCREIVVHLPPGAPRRFDPARGIQQTLPLR